MHSLYSQLLPLIGVAGGQGCGSSLHLNTNHWRAEIVACSLVTVGAAQGGERGCKAEAVKPYLFLSSCSVLDTTDFKKLDRPRKP